jgi:hypothetical protein
MRQLLQVNPPCTQLEIEIVLAIALPRRLLRAALGSI